RAPGRGRLQARGAARAAAPLRRGVDRLPAGCRRGWPVVAQYSGPAAQRRTDAAGLSLPSALRPGGGTVPARTAATDILRRRPSCRLPRDQCGEGGMRGGAGGDAPPLLRVDDLVVHFRAARGRLVRAVNGASFDLKPGETLGLVGESGCGKSTLGRALLRLGPITAGTAHVDGIDIAAADSTDIARLRRETAMI